MPAINGAVHVEIMRRGGIAGVALRGSFETSDLSPSARDEIDQALRVLLVGARAAEPRHPDGFRLRDRRARRIRESFRRARRGPSAARAASDPRLRTRASRSARAVTRRPTRHRTTTPPQFTVIARVIARVIAPTNEHGCGSVEIGWVRRRFRQLSQSYPRVVPENVGYQGQNTLLRWWPKLVILLGGFGLYLD